MILESVSTIFTGINFKWYLKITEAGKMVNLFARYKVVLHKKYISP